MSNILCLDGLRVIQVDHWCVMVLQQALSPSLAGDVEIPGPLMFTHVYRHSLTGSQKCLTATRANMLCASMQIVDLSCTTISFFVHG